MTTIPQHVLDTLATLREQRGPRASRLDAIDLAIDNLSRVFGLHGTAQPLPLIGALEDRQGRGGSKKRHPRVLRGAAAARRAKLLAIIVKSERGATISQIRKSTPAMASKDRSNALSRLKGLGKIRRSGKTWVKAAA